MSEGVSAGLCHKDQRVMPLLVTCGDRTIDCLAVDSCNFLDHLDDGPVAEFPHDIVITEVRRTVGVLCASTAPTTVLGCRLSLLIKSDYLKRITV